MGDGWLEGPAVGRVLESVAGEDLAVGEEVGEEPVVRRKCQWAKVKSLERKVDYLLAKHMSAAPRVQRRLEGSKR